MIKLMLSGGVMQNWGSLVRGKEPQKVEQDTSVAKVFANIKAVEESLYQAYDRYNQSGRSRHDLKWDEILGPTSSVPAMLGALTQTLHALNLEQLPERVMSDLNVQVRRLIDLSSRVLPREITKDLSSIAVKLTDLKERARFQGQDASVVKVFADIKEVQESIHQATDLYYERLRSGDYCKRGEILGPNSSVPAMLDALTQTLHSLNLEPLPERLLSDLTDAVRQLSDLQTRVLPAETTRDLSSIQVRLAYQEERARFHRAAQLKEYPDHGDYLRQLLADPQIENADDVFDRALGVSHLLSIWHKDHTAGMLGYQPMPLRPLAELLAAMEIGPNDTFCDLGAGLGRPSLLVHLLTGARCISVEYVKDTYETAKAIADNNNIDGIEYVNADAATFNMGRANKFYMFNPFSRALLDTVVRKLEERVQAGGTDITVGAHGDCIWAFEKSPYFAKVGDDFDKFCRGAVFKGKIP